MFCGLEQPPPIYASPPHLPAGLPSAPLLPYWWPQLGLRPRPSLKPFSHVSPVQGLPKLGQAHHQPPSSTLRVECFNQEPPWVLLAPFAPRSAPPASLPPSRASAAGVKMGRVRRCAPPSPGALSLGVPVTLASLLCLRPPALGPGTRASPDTVRGRTKADFHPTEPGGRTAEMARLEVPLSQPRPARGRGGCGSGAETARELCPARAVSAAILKPVPPQGHPPPRPRALHLPWVLP